LNSASSVSRVIFQAVSSLLSLLPSEMDLIFSGLKKSSASQRLGSSLMDGNISLTA
jgi:hypothetical protein